MINATEIPLKQFLPAAYCFACKACCVFESTTTPWRPFMPQEEKLRSCLVDPERAYDNEIVAPDGFVHAVCEEGKGRCGVFNKESFRCERYLGRPFECQIYPFMIVTKDDKPYLAAHLSCPFMQEHWRDELFNEYVDYMIKYVEQPLIKNFLERNPGLARPYNKGDQFDFVYELRFDKELPGCSVLEHRQLLDKCFAEAGINLSLYTFPGVAVWETIFSIDIREIDGMICVFFSDEATTFMFFPPIGKGDVAKVSRKCFEIMERVNGSSGISRMDNVPDSMVPFFPENEFVCAYKTDEFIYQREAIAGLVGNTYKSKRSDYNQFVRLYQPEFVPFENEMAQECLQVFDRWVTQKAEEASEEALIMRHEAREYHRMILKQPDVLGYTGRVVRVGGKIVGYTFGYPVDQRDFCVFAEITDRSLKGMPAYIFREFCRDKVVEPFERVNVMDAFALPSIAETKHSFHPHATLPIYMVYKADI
ncbi:MAG TPA: phosphatidylglycerol lysyltransferase domain-containing protein [Candidatus Bathyarchaeia archaeon]|nr:phosphatidylglycerol lysyltransferase domain-containing protein [Candidatus Bathyarchaeia archaeon]